MYLVIIAWLYVTLMMAAAEATSSNGSVLGAVVTFVLYGLLPMVIVIYILDTPRRKRQLHARRHAQNAAQAEPHSDKDDHSSCGTEPYASRQASATASVGAAPAVGEKS